MKEQKLDRIKSVIYRLVSAGQIGGAMLQFPEECLLIMQEYKKEAFNERVKEVEEVEEVSAELLEASEDSNN